MKNTITICLFGLFMALIVSIGFASNDIVEWQQDLQSVPTVNFRNDDVCAVSNTNPIEDRVRLLEIRMDVMMGCMEKLTDNWQKLEEEVKALKEQKAESESDDSFERKLKWV